MREQARRPFSYKIQDIKDQTAPIRKRRYVNWYSRSRVLRFKINLLENDRHHRRHLAHSNYSWRGRNLLHLIRLNIVTKYVCVAKVTNIWDSQQITRVHKESKRYMDESPLTSLVAEESYVTEGRVSHFAITENRECFKKHLAIIVSCNYRYQHDLCRFNSLTMICEKLLFCRGPHTTQHSSPSDIL